MSDHELLEAAAKAAGIELAASPFMHRHEGYALLADGKRWGPLVDDGDALRLAAKLDMPTGFDGRFADLGLCVYATYPTGELSCNSIMQSVAEAGSKEAALRRAIVRAAAAIAKALPVTTKDAA